MGDEPKVPIHVGSGITVGCLQVRLHSIQAGNVAAIAV